MCRSSQSKEGFKSVSQSRELTRLLKVAKIKCISPQCDFVADFEELTQHQADCVLALCNYCEQVLNISDLRNHQCSLQLESLGEKAKLKAESQL